MGQNSSGQRLFAAIKATAHGSHPHLVLPVGSPLRGMLRPIATVQGGIEAEDVRLLTQWRNLHVKSFLTEFAAVNGQTEKWLGGAVHANPGKMLFMVVTPSGECVGHVGLGFIDWEKAYGEADAIVSGGNSPRGLMKESLLTLMRWAKDVLGLETLAVRVRSDNKAVEFYRKVGFVEFKRIPLVATAHAGGIDWAEDVSAVAASASLVYMQLDFAN